MELEAANRGPAVDASAVDAREAGLPVPGASLWLRATSLSALPNGAPVASWGDQSPSGTAVTQGAAR
jgi:hypothetical protein